MLGDKPATYTATRFVKEDGSVIPEQNYYYNNERSSYDNRKIV